MEENRDQILLDFQSCTGVEDIAECIMYLEATNWNLLDAINNVMPQETQTLPSEHTPPPLLEEVNMEPVAPPIQAAPPSSRIAKFSIQFKEELIALEIPDCEPVATLKTALFHRVGVPVCRQTLKGWKVGGVNDDTLIAALASGGHATTALQLSVENDFIEIDQSGASSSNFSDCLNLIYGIRISDQTHQQEYSVNFPGAKTVQQVKQDVYALTNIPVRHQKWSGWPEAAKDENTTLAAVQLNLPIHELLLWDNSNSRTRRQPIVDLGGSDSSNEGEDFEDAPECLTVDDSVFQTDRHASKRMNTLMPDNVNDETEAVSHFNVEFENRYGSCRPSFFAGTLSSALLSSCQKPAKERRPLVVYLHDDSSVLTNVFCSRLLCSETIVSYLTFNFVCWPWDLTLTSNRNKLLSLVTAHLGVTATSAITSIMNNLPALMVIGRARSTTEVISVIPANVGLDELMTSLVHGLEMFNAGLTNEIKEEDERNVREQVKQEQDEAYEASLQADRLKDRERENKREEKRKQEKEEEETRQEEERRKMEQEQIKQAERLSLIQQLPVEPAEEEAGTTKIRIRLPNGQSLVRRFSANQPIRLLLIYLASEGFPPQDYKVLASWPRKDLSCLDVTQTFQDLNLYPQEMVTLEER